MGHCETTPSKCKFSWLSSLIQSPLLLVIRLIWGLLFVKAGWGKIMNMGATVDYFTSIQLPLPFLLAWTVATIEVVGGALLAFGLYARAAALPLVGVMVGALVTAHRDATMNIVSDFATFMQQLPFTYLFAALTILAFGPGFFSLDRVRCWRKRKECCPKTKDN